MKIRDLFKDNRMVYFVTVQPNRKGETATEYRFNKKRRFRTFLDLMFEDHRIVKVWALPQSDCYMKSFKFD